MKRAAAQERPSRAIVADEGEGAWVEFDCDGCSGRVVRRRCHYLRQSSGFHFCATCSRDGTANRVRAEARVTARRSRVAKLYPEMRLEAIAAELGVSTSLVFLDLEALVNAGAIEKVPLSYEERAEPMRGRTFSPETRGRMAAAKRGKPRPDVATRVAAMHADPAARAAWGVALTTGRGLSGKTIRKWKNRANGLKGHRRPEREADTEYDAKSRKVMEARARNPDISERALERLSGLSRRQVRAVLAEHL